MNTFRHFLLEQDQQEVKAHVAELEAKVKEISLPHNIERAIKATGARNIDELISKLKSNPVVIQVIQKYKQLQSSPQAESVSENIVGDVFSGIFHGLKTVIGWGLKSLKNTIKDVLFGFGQDAGLNMSEKLDYASALLLTLGLGGVLLAAGAPVAVAAATVPWMGTWWALRWFGSNFIKPMILWAEG